MADLPWFLMSFSDKQTYFCYKMANKEIKIPSHKLIWMFSLIYFDRFIISNKLFFDDKGVSLLRIKMVIYFFFSILHILFKFIGIFHIFPRLCGRVLLCVKICMLGLYTEQWQWKAFSAVFNLSLFSEILRVHILNTFNYNII